jgi:hypothetical protein
MNNGQFLFTFMAGALFASCLFTGPTLLGLAFLAAFGINGALLVRSLSWETTSPAEIAREEN